MSPLDRQPIFVWLFHSGSSHPDLPTITAGHKYSQVSQDSPSSAGPANTGQSATLCWGCRMGYGCTRQQYWYLRLTHLFLCRPSRSLIMSVLTLLSM